MIVNHLSINDSLDGELVAMTYLVYFYTSILALLVNEVLPWTYSDHRLTLQQLPSSSPLGIRPTAGAPLDL